MKFSMTKLFAVILALVMCMGVLVSCNSEGIDLDGVKADPYKAVTDGSDKYTKAVSGSYSDAVDAMEAITAGSATYNLKIGGESSDELLSSAATTVDMTLVTDNAGKFSGKATVGMMGFSTDVSVWGDDNNVAISAPALFGEEKYGIKLDTLEEDFKDSALFKSFSGGMTYDEFVAGLESDMGVSFDEILGSITGENAAVSVEEYTQKVEEVIKGLGSEVTEGVYADVDVITVKYTVTKEDVDKLLAIFDDMYNGLYNSIYGAVADAPEMTDLGTVYDEIKEAFKDGATLTFHLREDNGVLIGENISAGADMSIDMNFGAKSGEVLDIAITVNAKVDGEAVKIVTNIDEETEGDKSGFVLAVEADMGGESANAKIRALRNKADGKYEIKGYADDEEVLSATGVLTYSATDFKLTVDSITVDGEDTGVTMEISAKTGGTVEAVPQYKSVFELTEEDLGALEMFGGLLGSYEDSGEDYVEGWYDEEYADSEFEIDYDDLFGEDYEVDFEIGEDYEIIIDEDYEIDYEDFEGAVNELENVLGGLLG